MPIFLIGIAEQSNAKNQTISTEKIISIDSTYFDNIGYADLSDFFYIWLRRFLKFIFPNLFTTLLVPKAEELVATPYRHGGKEKAERFFMEGMTCAMHQLADLSHSVFPATIYWTLPETKGTKS